MTAQHDSEKRRSKSHSLINFRRSSTNGDANFGTEPVESPGNSNSLFLSKIRTFNTLALHSIGSVFSGTKTSSRRASAYMRETDSYVAWNGDDSELSPRKNALQNEEDEKYDIDLTPIPQDYCNLRAEDYCAAKALDYLSVSPSGKSHLISAADTRKVPEFGPSRSKEPHISARFPDIRRFLSLSRPHRTTMEHDIDKLDAITHDTADLCLQSPNLTSNASLYDALGGSEAVVSVSSSRCDLETPPLTPDSFNNYSLPSPSLSLDCFDPSLGLEEFCTSVVQDSPLPRASSVSERQQLIEEQRVLYESPQLLEVKEGKKPERPDPIHIEPERKILIGKPREEHSFALSDDREEWYGLEYTLSMSSRERQPSSDLQSSSVGEHSRSRESWAAIHRGAIDPALEHEDYIQWRNWRRFLDRQDAKKRHQKGLQFKATSKELAWLFVDEMKTRDVMYWQKETYGVVAREVKERLQYITERRPDPFFPPRRHNLGWYLRQSRSVGCLRELKARDMPAAEDGLSGAERTI